jgi:spermidine synthase
METGFEVIERCSTERGELQLQRRGADYEIISNGVFLMATYNGDSERQLVSLPLGLSEHPRRVLIGGLGVGFSTQEALQDSRVTEVVVVEVEPKVIEWNHTYLSPLLGNYLCDPRIRIIEADLLPWLAVAKETFDVICLDIDNGPDWTVTKANSRLYTEAGLQSVARLLHSPGIVAFWSAARSGDFQQRLGQYFDSVQEHPVECRRGEPDYIYLAQSRPHK